MTRISGPYGPLEILVPAGGWELARSARMIWSLQILKGVRLMNTWTNTLNPHYGTPFTLNPGRGGRKNIPNPKNKQRKEGRKEESTLSDILITFGTFQDLSWQYLSGQSYVNYSLLFVVFLIMQMSVNLFITLQKYTQQIDLTQTDWFPDRVFMSRNFTHLTIHPLNFF